MKKNDMFGYLRELKIQKSGVRDIFTPHKPINSIELFFGRQKEVQRLIEQMNTPGQHAILYGERGVGKSSLANIATKLLKEISCKELYIKRCDSNDTFLSIIKEVLKNIGNINVNVEIETKTLRQDGKATLKIPLVEGGIGSERIISTTCRSSAFTPSVVSDILKDIDGLFYIDEADRVQDKNDKVALAELIKLLSDIGSDFKILIVGIADTAEKLTGGHQSVNRCLKETFLRRMNDNEIRQIITEGAKKIKIQFNDSVVEKIVKLSSGYPHFTHLLALKCVEEAIGKELSFIDENCLQIAINSAVEDSDNTLRNAYNKATRSNSTNMYKKILLAASMIEGAGEFTATDLRDKFAILEQKEISPVSLNNFLRRLVANDFSGILNRCAKGIYKFSDPRMASFIRMKHDHENDVELL